MTKGKQCGYGYKQSIEEDNASFVTEHSFFSLFIIACSFFSAVFKVIQWFDLSLTLNKSD